ncbi:MAG TPA: DUF2344 domain-containing protein [Desulfobulbaceae bacterium]|nr:DUF2344 domain-containing protein [Desulfobulbaceae bacterium]
MSDLEAVLAALNREFPETIRVTAVELVGKKVQVDQEITYEMMLPVVNETDTRNRLTAFLQSDEYIIERIRKRKRRTLDIRPLVRSLCVRENLLEIVLINHHDQAGVSPFEILEKVIGLTTVQARSIRIKKTAVRALQTDG